MCRAVSVWTVSSVLNLMSCRPDNEGAEARKNRLKAKIAEVHKQLAAARGVSVEEYESPEYQAKMERERDALEREESVKNEFERKELQKLKRHAIRIGMVIGIGNALVALYVGRGHDVRLVLLTAFAFIVGFVGYNVLVWDRLMKIESDFRGNVKETWWARWRALKMVDSAFGFCATIVFLLLMFHARLPPVACHQGCHWCEQAIEDFYDQEPPDRRP